MPIPVDIYMALMTAGLISIQEQNAHAYNWWASAVDMEHAPESCQHVIDFSDTTERREGAADEPGEVA